MSRQILLALFAILFLYLIMEAPSIFAVFFTALAFAYLLQPIAKKLSLATHAAYSLSSIVVYIMFMALLTTTLSFTIPSMIKQAETLILKIPEFQKVITTHFLPSISEKLNDFAGYNIAHQIRVALESYTTSLGNFASYTANFIWHSLLSTLTLISMLVLFPILLFFFLKDWNHITHNFKTFITDIGFNSLNSVWDQTDDLIAGFIKALFNVSIILAIYYTLALSVIGYEFPLLVGIMAGFAVMIPFIGAIIAISIAISISLLNHGLDIQQVYIFIAFMIGQTLDSSVLTPKIVGDRIGLHPTAIIFSVLVSSQVLGIAGIFLAIPLAGFIKIIFAKFILQKS